MKYLSLLLLFLIPKLMAQMPLDSEFTYQGELKIAGVAVTGAYDFTFKLYNASSSGTQVGSDVFVDNVQVDNGLFTTAIDFTSSSFVGDKLWLEISVRDGNATGGFQQLLPRQAITAAPYATHSQFVGADAVTSVEILDGSITAADLGNNSVAKAEIAANAVGSSEIISNQVQHRVAGNCATGQFITKVNEDGTVTCVDDNTGLSSVTTADIVDGAVTSAKIATGAVGSNAINSTQVQRRVAGNCAAGQFITAVNADGTVSCANDNTGLSSVTTADIIDGAVTSAKIAVGAVGSNAINSTQVQKRVIGSCIYPLYVSSIDVNGNLVCGRIPTARVNILDSVDDVGVNTSIAIGADNNPIISYSGKVGFGNDLKLVKCINQDCLDFNSPLIFDSSFINSTFIGADNNPIISYVKNGTVKLVKCSTQNYSSSISPLTLDTGSLANEISLAIGTDNNPIISYVDAATDTLKIIKCTSQNCSSHNLPVSLVTSTGFISNARLAIGADNNPIISFQNGSLYIVKCTNQSCTSHNAPQNLDATLLTGGYNSTVIGADGNPIISYNDDTNGALKIIKCTNQNCSLHEAPQTLDLASVQYISMALGSDNNPIISYYDSINKNLKVAKCQTQNCSTNTLIHVIDSGGDVGSYSSIAIGTDNNPIISYYDGTNGDLKVYKCVDQSCSL